MKFATLFLIGSAVLALQSDENSDYIDNLDKKDAAPFRGSYMGSGYRNTLGNQFKNKNGANGENGENGGNGENRENGENYNNYDNYDNYVNYDNIEYNKRDAAPNRGSYMGSGWRNTLGNQFKNHNNKREDSENIELAKKDAAPAGGAIVYPTDEQDDDTNPNYRYRNGNEQIPGKAWGEQFVIPVKDRTDKYGIPCVKYVGEKVRGVPEECMKTVFCRNGEGGIRMGCDRVSFDINTWTKQKLLDDGVDDHCVGMFICKNEDMYDP